MAASWTPPPHGTPCWINILATDVLRARKFYEDVFGWKFRDTTTRMDGIEEDPTEIQHFSLGSTSPGGGITKVKGGGLIKTEGKGGSILYLAVNDLEETMKRIIAGGGKQMSEIMPEGGMASMQHYEDSEGNFGGLYMWHGK